MPTTQIRDTRCAVACNYCRLKKGKCNGARPCNNCSERGENCQYPIVHRKTPNKVRKTNKVLEERLARLESLIEPNEADLFPPPANSDRTYGASAIGHPILRQQNSGTIGPPTSLQDKPLDSVSAHQISVVSIPTAPHTVEPVISSQLYDETSGISAGPGPATIVSDEVVIDTELGTTEHHGPRSFLAICSTPGMMWVSQKTGLSGFDTCCKTLAMDLIRRLKIDRTIQIEKAPEVDAETAWRYSGVFFEESFGKAYGAVNRPEFEARLKAHFRGVSSDEPAWYALRNTVYAFGCRAILSKGIYPKAFNESQTQSWRFFENALSVHTDLIYSRTGILAVQALLAMACFVDGIGSPAIEYMLLSNAISLAQSKGLHLQPAATLEMSNDEIEDRNSLFWAIYCYEKHISYRSGRPSAIDDDDISCELPTRPPEGSTIALEIFIHTIKHAQISSAIAKRLLTAKAFKAPLEQTMATMQDLEGQLHAWHQSLPPHLRVEMPLDPSHKALNLHQDHLMYFYFAYHGSLISIHSAFSQPWSSSFAEKGQSPTFRKQAVKSTKTIVEASRNLILATKHVNVDSSSPVWLSFFMPMVGLINLFIFVLRYPKLASTLSDVALMDVVVGHFSYLEYVSGAELSFLFPREVTSVARTMVYQARERTDNHQTKAADSTPTGENGTTLDFLSYDEFGSINEADTDMENWPGFLPSFPHLSSMAGDWSTEDQDLDFLLQ